MIEKIKEILVEEIDCKLKDIKPDSLIMEDLGADSLSVIQITVALEDEFGIEVPDEDIINLKTPNDIIKYIESKK